MRPRIQPATHQYYALAVPRCGQKNRICRIAGFQSLYRALPAAKPFTASSEHLQFQLQNCKSAVVKYAPPRWTCGPASNIFAGVEAIAILGTLAFAAFVDERALLQQLDFALVVPIDVGN